MGRRLRSRGASELAATGLREGLTASRALGYRQVLRFLDGDISEAQARELTVAATRKFARRQDSWFRKDTRISWLPYDHPELVSDAYALAGPTGTGPVHASNPDPSWKTDPHAEVVVREGTRHPQRLRRSFSIVSRCWRSGLRRCASSATAAAALAPTACCAPYSPSTSTVGLAMVRSGSWTTATLTDRSPRCAATGFRCSCGSCSTKVWSTGRSSEIATRSGIREAMAPVRRAESRASMGSVAIGTRLVVVSTVDGAEFKAVTADVGNPHAVSFADSLDELSLACASPMGSSRGVLRHGVNLEFVRRLGPRAHRQCGSAERGVGETCAPVAPAPSPPLQRRTLP